MPRDRIQPKKGNSRFVRSEKKGHFTESQEEIGSSLAHDRQQGGKKRKKGAPGDHKRSG